MIKKASFLPDLLITIPAFFLLSLSILVIYSSDSKLAIQQAIIAILGLIIYWFLSLVDFGSMVFETKYLYFGILILLIVVFLLGIETRGSTRWIQLLNWQFQPSEFAKPILILFLAEFWNKHLPNWKNILISFLWVLPLIGLIFRQPDLGTALTLFMIWLLMLIGANIAIMKLITMTFIAVILTPLTWVLMKDYQKARILSFLSPERDPLGIGYNVIQSTIAVGSGTFSGRGLGRGTQSRLQFLPEFRTDFMFASIAEEFGFIGSVLVMVLYGIIIARSLQLVTKAGDRFKSLLIFGVLGMLFFQIVINIGMNIGIMPITGITLPLLSYGGSSVITTLISLSFIASVARFKKKDFRN